MVGGHAVSQFREHARTLNVGRGLRRLRHVVEVRRAPDVCGLVTPGERLTAFHLHAFPVRISVEDGFVVLGVHARIDRLLQRVVHFLLRWPEVAQVNRLAVAAFTKGIVQQIFFDRSCERVSNHQRWRHQVVGAHVGVDSPFKVAIA